MTYHSHAVLDQSQHVSARSHARLIIHVHVLPHIQACFWDTSDLSVMRCVRVTNTVLQVDLQGGFLAIGSTNIQLVDTTNLDKRRTVADDTVSDESLQVCLVGGWESGRGFVKWEGGRDEEGV